MSGRRASPRTERRPAPCESDSGFVRSIPDATADLVAAIGDARFPDRFLAVMRALAGVELCSVFQRERRDSLRLVFAAGEMAGMPDFPTNASRDYARCYWRADSQLAGLAGTSRGDAPLIVRRHASEIADPAYRAACYDRAGVGERMSILCPGAPGFVASGYRTTTSGRFTAEDAERLEAHAALLLAALRQHLRAEAAAGFLFDEAALVERLLALDCHLSVREAEIAAAMILGATQEAITEAKRLSLATVVTYRRRAYAKLGVASRRELVALHRRWVADLPARSH